MKTSLRISSFLVLPFLFILALPRASFAQCYINQNCFPVDDLTYIPNGTGQVYHGDGASNNGVGGWTTSHSDVNQCLSCHSGADTLPYLMTGHKNTLRKVAPGTLWSGPDGASYSALDNFYGSGSIFSWSTNQTTVGWCTPLATSVQIGTTPIDASCQYPFYTLPNADAPANYTPVAPTATAGGLRSLFYLYGGWQNYGGITKPSATQLNAIFDHGFIGDLYPDGNFDCARCHATGYNFDDSAPEPTQNTSKVSWIPDANFKRVPSDGYIAPGTSGTSSWYLSGIQCERCHVAAYGYGSHPWGSVKPTIPRYEGATALCVECHRGETIVAANPTANPPVTGSINPSNTLKTLDHGYCSDVSGSPYAECVSNSENQWIYKPYVDHEAGQSFLNSPHARFSGTLVQTAQHSPDLSVTFNGAYASQFSEAIADPTKNLGCTGCHDPHQSTVPGTNGKPITTTCNQCHKLSNTIMGTINHPMGPGTPFPTGTSADIPGACITCHMQAALGRANSHFFRINSDPNYFTFPSSSQLYTENVSTLATAPEFSPMNLSTFNSATWLDVDLACGQCHVGNNSITNEYNLTLPPGMPGAHAYFRVQLAHWASFMHPPDPGVPVPTFSPAPGIYHSPQTVTMADAQGGAVIYYTLDGSQPNTNSPVYSTPLAVSASTNIYAIATYPGYPASRVVLGSYNIQLPTAPPPLFSPPPTTFSSSQFITLLNTLNLPMFFTTDGSTPTVNSTRYTTPIPITHNTTISAITIANGYLNSSVLAGNFLIQAPTPTFSPAAGNYFATQTAMISDVTAGATIYYTTNGTTPSNSSTPCSNPCSVNVATSTTLKAIASGGGYAASNVVVAAYTISASAPVFSPVAGTYYSPQTVTITDATSGVTIYYTTNNTFPTTSSPSCTSPCTVPVSTTTTLRAIALGNGISQSTTVAGSYTIAANTPTFSPGSGTYSTPQIITISDSTLGVMIYYTIDNSFPNTSSPSCTSPCTIPVSTTTTMRAMALGNGISQSSTAVAVYTITGH